MRHRARSSSGRGSALRCWGRLAEVGLLATLTLSSACTGDVLGANSPAGANLGGSAGMSAGMSAGTAGSAGSVSGTPGSWPVMRRLTSREYNNTVEDLLGDDTHPADAFDPDATDGGFDNQVALLNVNASRARQYWTAAERLAESANVQVLSGCDALQLGEEICASQFARSFGKRAFRRPLVAEELAILLEVYRIGRQGDSHDRGLRQMLKAMLVMPPFLYRLDVTPGSTATGPSSTVPVDAYQLASRLSYTFVQSTPDAALLAAADSGELSTSEQIAGHVTRLMNDPRAHAMSLDFYNRWLGLNAIGKVTKAATLYPAFNDALRGALSLEMGAFLEHTLWKEAGTLGAFFGAAYSFRNQLLSEHYGDSSVVGGALTLTPLNPERSAGILTLGGLMSILSTPEHTDPVRRGKFIRERLLCQTVPPPPPGVVAAFPPFDPTATTRQRFATHQSQPSCASCHRMMDGIGLGFETFDAVGVYRSTEQGLPVDGSGELVNTDVDGPFVGPRALADKLASSRQVQDCLTRTWFRFISGREASEADATALESLRSSLATRGQKSLLEAATQTPLFLTRGQEGLP